MCGGLQLFECLLLPDEILLSGIRHRHVAGVRRKANLLARWRRADVVMRRSAVPDDQVAWLHAYFFPLQTLVRQPLHPGWGEAVPSVADLVSKNP